MHPLDLVKTRLQVSKNEGFVDCIKSTYRSEGALGFYKVHSLICGHFSGHPAADPRRDTEESNEILHL